MPAHVAWRRTGPDPLKDKEWMFYGKTLVHFDEYFFCHKQTYGGIKKIGGYVYLEIDGFGRIYIMEYIIIFGFLS